MPAPMKRTARPSPAARAGKSGRRVRAARPRSARVSVVIADSQAIDRGGLVELLEAESDFDVIGEAATVAEAIQQCRALGPDVLLLSLNLPGQEQAAAIPTIREALATLRIVALSERGVSNCLVLNPPYRQQSAAELDLVCAVGVDCLQLAVAQGAMATVRRSADPEDLFRAIRNVASGGAWYDPTTARGIMSATAPQSGPQGPRSGRDPNRAILSPGESKVAALIAEGRSNKEISTALAISEATVKKHVGHILTKLGLADRLQVGLLLARNPLVLKPRS